MPLKISMTTDSVVNERTGEIEAPSEYVDNLRAIERAIAALDDEIEDRKSALKTAREQRELRVGQLRAAVRDGKVLPLFEADGDDVTDDDLAPSIDDEEHGGPQ